jgi:hypothetical protein
MANRGSKIRTARWRILVGTAALGAAALGVTSSGLASASASTDEAPSSTVVVECSTGTITQGDVQMSASFAARVPAGQQPDLPGGCTVQTG